VARRSAIALDVALHTGQVVTGLESAKAFLGIAGRPRSAGVASAPELTTAGSWSGVACPLYHRYHQ
jgi:hypothetical protein